LAVVFNVSSRSPQDSQAGFGHRLISDIRTSRAKMKSVNDHHLTAGKSLSMQSSWLNHLKYEYKQIRSVINTSLFKGAMTIKTLHPVEVNQNQALPDRT